MEMLEVDRKELMVIRAVTYAKLGLPIKASESWASIIRWASIQLPPHDESVVVYLLQSALCDLAASRPDKATRLVSRAMRVHDVCFGGGGHFMALRYKKELMYNKNLIVDPKYGYQLWGMIADASGDAFQFADS